MSTQPMPVIACGKVPPIGKQITEHLKPEYEVIHFILSMEAAEDELPHLLAGRGPKCQNPNDIGTHDYSRLPRAVIFGRGYSPEQVEDLKKKFAGFAQEPVVWMRGNPADLPAGGVAPPDYVEKIVGRMKKEMRTWRDGEGDIEKTLVY